MELRKRARQLLFETRFDSFLITTCVKKEIDTDETDVYKVTITIQRDGTVINQKIRDVKTYEEATELADTEIGYAVDWIKKYDKLLKERERP